MAETHAVVVASAGDSMAAFEGERLDDGDPQGQSRRPAGGGIKQACQEPAEEGTEPRTASLPVLPAPCARRLFQGICGTAGGFVQGKRSQLPVLP